MNCANHPDRERIAFCQNCGKPLCTECARTVGTAVFCEPCLAARLAAVDPAVSSAGTPYGNVNMPYGVAAPSAPGAPNPVLAGLLGLIPGVGAMYNGQYAKGVVHLVIFAVLVSLSNSDGVFGLLVAGWIFYQVFEAYHTARARRDGTVLPNPFGLNDIGEKLGFGKSWPGPIAAPAVTPVPDAGATYRPPVETPFTPRPEGSQAYAAGDRTPFAQVADATPGFRGLSPYSNAAWSTQGSAPYVPPVPPIPPYSAPFSMPDSSDLALVDSRNRFPVGAIILIVLGILFFFGSSGWLRHFPVQRIIPFLLIATGVWIFVRKMTNSGLSIADDGTPVYQLRLFRALRGAIWIIMIGVLFLLDTFDILSWAHSWPLLIIVAGLMTFFERSASSAAAQLPYGYAPYSPAAPGVPAQPMPAASTGTSVVPSTPANEESR